MGHNPPGRLAYSSRHKIGRAVLNYHPYKAGTLNRSHKVNLVKAGLALAFAYHEVHTAYALAQGSKSRTLHVLTLPMSALANRFQALKDKVKGGTYTAGDMSGLNSQANGFQSLAGRTGYSFHDQQVSL